MCLLHQNSTVCARKNKTSCEDEDIVYVCECHCFSPSSSALTCQIRNVAVNKTVVTPSIDQSSVKGYQHSDSIKYTDGSELDSCTTRVKEEMTIKLNGEHVILSITFVNQTSNLILKIDGRFHRGREKDGDNQYFNLTRTQLRNISVVNNSSNNIRLSEVVMEGYKYIECDAFEGEYFYGSGCLTHCHCSVQCDYINGTCSGGCNNNAFNIKEVCRCSEGHWGLNCSNVCECKNKTETCDEQNVSQIVGKNI